MMEFFQSVLDWYMANLNYFTVWLLMLIESTFLPMPSEVVIPFAAYKAAQGDLNVFLVILFGTIGALCGSLINYYLSYFLGRPIIYAFADSKAGRLFLLSKEKVIKAENYFLRNGKSSTFIGRLVPGIRHLISIPAGLAKMNLRDFILYTFIGAGIWNVILAIIGYYVFEYSEKIFPYLDKILYALGALFIIYLIVKTVRNSKKNKK
ncbi:MAG: DedA family protein [Bacteroidales bacterium]|jgi:membrane protein DedA with SNARE-associated domain|nr:DedA family protein [Bacteroidales bacterium]